MAIELSVALKVNGEAFELQLVNSFYYQRKPAIDNELNLSLIFCNYRFFLTKNSSVVKHFRIQAVNE